MIRIFKVAFILVAGVFFTACTNDSEGTVMPVIPFSYVYPGDLKDIEEYLNTYYIKEITPDLDVVFEKIPAGNPDGLISIMDQTDHPIQFKTVRKHSLDYKLYYLNLREAGNYGIDKSPTQVDSVFVSYKGTLLNDIVFEDMQNPVWNTLDNVVTGWKELFPDFKSGTYVDNGNGTVTYSDFGAGVMFLPSGLGYYNQSKRKIPSYSPLIFSFKLKNVKYRDHDKDGILSKDEDLNGDGRYTKLDDDTDGDGIRNYLDIDDDGDGWVTKAETRFTYTDGPDTKTGYYPYNGAAVDDPATPYDDRRGIPRRFTGAPGPAPDFAPTSVQEDFTEPTRLRRHLDKTCKPPLFK